ncbi:hypothetical protein [Burkholderia ubonensis]|uniref:hypothetical protein n=1 Tax=Burkholderia ubonensis TaxID=101571 RepID=UPI0007563238|nr:hypothetical protein [Burkholderia ubonensis]KVW77432.1 hypothetical protein WK99_27955 [Burkholderia ubonensis]
MRKYAAAIIDIAGAAASLAVMWQAVRFCRGEVSAPIVDQVAAMAEALFPAVPNGDPPPATVVFGWIGQGFHYLYGIAVWILLGYIVSCGMRAIARIVAVGFRQYRAEKSAAFVEDARRARIQTAWRRRRELRRERSEPQSGGVFSAIAIGTLFGLYLCLIS